MKIRIASYFRNRRERKLRMWCIEMAAKLVNMGNPTEFGEEIYRWVNGIPEKKK